MTEYSPAEIEMVEKQLDRARDNHGKMPESAQCFLVFIGFGRSGHSFFGQCLNAHRDCLVANEGRIDIVADRYRDRDLYFAYLEELDRRFRRRGYQKIYGDREKAFGNSQNLRVDSGFQGCATAPIVIGNSKAGRTARWCVKDRRSFETFRAVLNLPFKIILQTRHPAAMLLSSTKRTHIPMDKIANRLTQHCALVEQAVSSLAADCPVLQMSHESLLADPVSVLDKSGEFLGLDRDQDHIDAVCAATQDPDTESPMAKIEDASVLGKIEELIDRYDFFAEYRR